MSSFSTTRSLSPAVDRNPSSGPSLAVPARLYLDFDRACRFADSSKRPGKIGLRPLCQEV
ncbi:MAG: hypothetical protein ABFD82_20315 [Syntrophaceae bacterium]